jgi:hypothetical protein
MEIARNIARELDLELLRVKRRLTSIATQPEFRGMDVAAQQETVTRHVQTAARLPSLFVLDAQGWFAAGTAEDLSTYHSKSYADQPFFAIPFERGEVYFGSPQFYSSTGSVGASVSVPIASSARERVGVLIGSVRLNDLIDHVANYPLVKDQVAL